jgi:hypothetical protein
LCGTLKCPEPRGGVEAIDTKRSTKTRASRQPPSRVLRQVRTLSVLLVLGVAVFVWPAQASAGQASTGELAFEPCTQCHPVTLGADGQPTKPLPIGLEKHEIELEKHDILGDGDEACLACHDDPTKNPGMLKLSDGSLVEITGDISQVCRRCHFEKYGEWQAGAHGKNEPKCTAAGCHDPHTPSWIYVGALPPYQGTGIEVRAVGDREPFKPLAPPPVPAPYETPLWLTIATVLGFIACIGIVGFVFVGRSKR